MWGAARSRLRRSRNGHADAALGLAPPHRPWVLLQRVATRRCVVSQFGGDFGGVRLIGAKRGRLGV